MKLTSSLLAVLLALTPVRAVYAVEDDSVREHFTYYQEVPVLLIADQSSGKILLEKNIDQDYPIASMSKLMTYYVVKSAIRDGKISLKDQVLISKQAAELNISEYSNYGLKLGERITVEDLLKGLMVVSGNDAAEALAEHVAGTKSAFAALMNDAAVKMELTKSSFVNPHGLTENGKMNRMSARDLCTLSRAIVDEFPEVLEYSKIKTIDEPSRGYREDSTLSTSFGDLAGLDGLKTGFTDEAGYCFTGTVAISKVDPALNYRVVTVMMGCEYPDVRWRTQKELIDYTVGSFRHRQLVDENVPIVKYDMPSAKEGSVTLYPVKSYSTLTFRDALFDIRYEIFPQVEAPTPQNHPFGAIYISRDGQPLEKIDIVSRTETKKASVGVRTQRAWENFVNFLSLLMQ